MSTTLSVVFSKVMNAFLTQGKTRASALLNKAPFQNELCAESPKDAPSFTDPKLVHTYFSRDEVQKQYCEQITNPNKSLMSVSIAAKAQSDMLSQIERDYVTQHGVTRVRSLMHAASRRNAHGSDNGPIAKGIKKYPEDLLKLSVKPEGKT